jgi:hypothetical protein
MVQGNYEIGHRVPLVSNESRLEDQRTEGPKDRRAKARSATRS